MKSLKRTMAIILSLCLLAGAVPFSGITAAADDKIAVTTAGDLDGNGVITDADAVYLLMYTFFPGDYPLN